jgi:hypothetical protein
VTDGPGPFSGLAARIAAAELTDEGGERTVSVVDRSGATAVESGTLAQRSKAKPDTRYPR